MVQLLQRAFGLVSFASVCPVPLFRPLHTSDMLALANFDPTKSTQNSVGTLAVQQIRPQPTSAADNK